MANEYLLLSGGVREGVVDLDLDELNVYARGTDYDMDSSRKQQVLIGHWQFLVQLLHHS